MILLSSPYDVQCGGLLIDSYWRAIGEQMLPEWPSHGPEAVRWLYDDAPFCLLTQDALIDPRFVYANVTAQKCFEYGWDEFVGLPSRLSAAAPDRRQRQNFMNTVLRQGYAHDYRGRRIAKSGRRFWIESATVWNILDREGIFQGQAVLIRRWADD